MLIYQRTNHQSIPRIRFKSRKDKLEVIENTKKNYLKVIFQEQVPVKTRAQLKY